ncbi:uncharacterized protein LOC136068440 [Quercus suber]|uniref:uncharacterized protein LOC136068440 n=1 Tax=Quercus suber TaxID=58331 RepID=UPI0032DFD229
MAEHGQQPAESGASQYIDPFLNLERRQDREGSVHTTHTERTQPCGGSHVSHAEKNSMQIEIERLRRELRHAKRKRVASHSDDDSNDGQDITYEQRSPFTRRIEGAKLPRRFNQPTFTIYNGKIDPMEHVSHFNQRMAVYSTDEALMCKTPSILIKSSLIQAFGSRFVTYRRVARPLSSLLSLSMREGESLKAYSDRYWEMFNDMEGNFDAMALETFKLGLPTDHGLRTSLSGKPVTNMRQLMDCIEKYKRVEEDQQQGKGKDKVTPQDRKDFRLDRYNNNKPRRDFVGQSGSANAQAVNTVFKEPVHQVLEKIKNESFFRWPSKMVGNPKRRNHNLYCQYHQDHGHATEDYRSLWDHLDQLVREGKLRHLLHHSSGQGGQENSESEKRDFAKPPLGIINVIFAAPGRTGSWPTKVMSVARLPPHDDALVVTLKIGGYDVKRVMVDQGRAVEIMYPDLFKGLNLTLDDLTPYCSPLISFEGRMVTRKGQIRLPVQTGSKIVEVDFIVVDICSPYTAIVARPWLHTLGAVSSTLHQKVKYPSEWRVCEIRGDQSSARQCLVATI